MGHGHLSLPLQEYTMGEIVTDQQIIKSQDYVYRIR